MFNHGLIIGTRYQYSTYDVYDTHTARTSISTPTYVRKNKYYNKICQKNLHNIKLDRGPVSQSI